MGYLKKYWNNYCDSKVCFGTIKIKKKPILFHIDKQSGKRDPNNNNNNNDSNNERSINFYSSVQHAHKAAIILTIGYPLIATLVTGNLEIFLDQLK